MLFHLDGVSRPDPAGLNYPRADTAASLECPRHARFAQVLYVPARWAWPVIFENRFPDPKPLPAQLTEPYAARDDVASVLAVSDPDAQLVLDVVEVFTLDKGDLAHVPESCPESRPLAITVALDAAALNGPNLLDALHLCAACCGHKNLVNHTLHLALLVLRAALGFKFTRRSIASRLFCGSAHVLAITTLAVAGTRTSPL